LETAYPARCKHVLYVNDDANKALVALCRDINWIKNRGVLFLDPFGMQVDWNTLCAVAKTKSIDVWYLVPTGMGIARLTPRDGNIPKGWTERLNRMLGPHDWKKEFYQDQHNPTLFDRDNKSLQKTADIPDIESFVIRRLKTIFPAVSSDVARIVNKQNSPMFSLVFACSNPNPKAYGLALKFAKHILKE